MRRAREADRKREAELRIQARQERRIKERIQEANTQVLAMMMMSFICSFRNKNDISGLNLSCPGHHEMRLRCRETLTLQGAALCCGRSKWRAPVMCCLLARGSGSNTWPKLPGLPVTRFNLAFMSHLALAATLTQTSTPVWQDRRWMPQSVPELPLIVCGTELTRSVQSLLFNIPAYLLSI
jgi:hypothetical protein